MNQTMKGVRVRHTHYFALKSLRRQIANVQQFLNSKEAADAPREDLEEINNQLSQLKQSFNFLEKHDTNTTV